MSVEDLENIVKELKDNEVHQKRTFIQIIDVLLPKLEQFKIVYENEGYQVISSSLFFFYDRDDPINSIDFKMIDFAHWKDREHQFELSDGYSVGISTIIGILKELRNENE